MKTITNLYTPNSIHNHSINYINSPYSLTFNLALLFIINQHLLLALLNKIRLIHLSPLLLSLSFSFSLDIKCVHTTSFM